MSTSCKTRIMGYYGGQAVALGLVLLALHLPAGAQQTPVVPIAFGQTVQGTLTSTDPVIPAGTPIDRYFFAVTAPGPFFIKASSPAVPLLSVLYRVAPDGELIGLQDASVFTPGQALGYFGVLAQPGRYVIEVLSTNPQQPTGSYTLSLTNAPPPAAPPAQ